MCSRLLWSFVSQPVLVGRNWDWTDVVETELYATPRGVERSGMTPTNPMTWRAKYASVAAVAGEALPLATRIPPCHSDLPHQSEAPHDFLLDHHNPARDCA
jgi:hypothetical protein